MALGTLTKGPVAIVLPVIVLAPVIGWHLRRAVGAGDRFRLPLDLSSVGIAVALFVLVAVPWYVAVTRAQGLGYLQQFFVGENIDRFATSRYNSWRGWEYIGVVVGGLLPWSLFGVLWIRPAAQVLRRRRALAPVEVSLLCWAIAPLLFFFVSVGSQARYVLPCLVPLAVLLGRALAVHTRRASPLVTWAGVAAGAVVGGAGLLLMRARPLLGAADPDWTAAGPIVIVLCGLGIAAAAWWLPRRMLPVIVALSAALAIVAFERTTLMPGRPEPVERIAALARAQNLPGPICACGAFARNLSFYSHVPTVVANTRETDAEVIAFLSRPDRVLAAVDSSVLTGVEEQMHRRFERLGEVTYLNTSIWSQRPATLLHPDRSALQRVVLVRNR
jgi:4-amino-4-deoxy-L-arabinose transferase-like glycosyltransferase